MPRVTKKTFRKWRESFGYQTKYVASYLGIKPNTLCHKESGYSQFNVDETSALLELYDIELKDVIRVKRKKK